MLWPCSLKNLSNKCSYTQMILINVFGMACVNMEDFDQSV